MQLFRQATMRTIQPRVAQCSVKMEMSSYSATSSLSSPYQNVLDNSTLIANIADFALGGKQNILLENFPFLFTQPVLQVYPAPEVQLTAEIISAISGLQTSLNT